MNKSLEWIWICTIYNVIAYDKDRKLSGHSLFLTNSMKFPLIMYSNLSGQIWFGRTDAYFGQKMSGDWPLYKPWYMHACILYVFKFSRYVNFEDIYDLFSKTIRPLKIDGFLEHSLVSVLYTWHYHELLLAMLNQEIYIWGCVCIKIASRRCYNPLLGPYRIDWKV